MAFEDASELQLEAEICLDLGPKSFQKRFPNALDSKRHERFDFALPSIHWWASGFGLIFRWKLLSQVVGPWFWVVFTMETLVPGGDTHTNPI